MNTNEARALLGERIRGRANGGPGGIFGGVEFEGEVVGIADTPQIIVHTESGHQHFSITTLADVEVQRTTWEKP